MAGIEASRTAVLVCQGRAVAHGRLAVGRFDDPTAYQLLREDERTPVERARRDAPPKGWAARMDFEMLGRQAEAMALRTVAVDDALRASGNGQVVIVGAGLDGRAWRMTELTEVAVFEVDHPSSQQDKRQRIADLQPVTRTLEFVAADLAHVDLDSALNASGHDSARPTTWILEGVIPYLTAEEASTTVRAIAARSAPGSTLVVTYQANSSRVGVVRLLARGMFVLMGRGDPMANEPRRSSWSAHTVQTLLVDAGFDLTDSIALAALARDLSVPDRHVHASHVSAAAIRSHN